MNKRGLFTVLDPIYNYLIWGEQDLDYAKDSCALNDNDHLEIIIKPLHIIEQVY